MFLVRRDPDYIEQQLAPPPGSQRAKNSLNVTIFIREKDLRGPGQGVKSDK
jgi:hypothetical protein